MSITHTGNLHFSWYFFRSISTQFSKVQIRYLVHHKSLAWAYDKHIKCFLRKTLTQICNLQIRIVHFYKNYSPLMTPSDAKGHQSSHAVYRVSQKKRTFRIIILKADTSERTDSRRFESDLSEVSACRVRILKVSFFGAPCICTKWLSAP